MRIAALVLAALALAGCEHDEHPFEVAWSASCAVEGMPPLDVVFDKALWLDDSGNRRQYVGEARLNLDNELFDSWLITVEVNLKDETAQTLDLVHVPIPPSFTDAYDLKTLDLQLETYFEDEEGTMAEMTGTCAWGSEGGALFMSMADDCDTCITCASLGPVLPGLVVFVPVLLGLRRRKQAINQATRA